MGARNHKVADTMRTMAASLVAVGVPYKEAFPLAGYSPKSEIYKDPRFKDTVELVRSQLRERPGYRMEDSVRFYRKMSEDKSQPASVRLKARQEMVTLLGQDAPKKMEINERQETASLITVLSKMDPEKLLAAEAEVRRVEALGAEEVGVAEEGEGVEIVDEVNKEATE